MPFVSTPILADFRATLANRLGDPGMVRWLSAELSLLICEAIRTWNSGAFYFRGRGSVTATVGEPFYDLPASLSDNLLAMSATTQQACTALEYSLMEPPTTNFSASWAGTEQFSFADITSAIEKRRNQFLRETGQIVSVAPLIPVTTGDGRVGLGDTYLDITRAAWKSLDNVLTNLWRVDEITLNRRLVGWNRNGGTPQAYSVVTTPETVLQIAPVPNDSGNLQLLAVRSGSTVDLTDSANLVGVFEDFVPAVIWGARAELLSKDGPARDLPRTNYCDQRFREGIELAKIMASTMLVYVNDEEVPIQSLERIDMARPAWQSTAAGTGVADVQCVVQAGPNLIGLFKVPSFVYAFTVDVVRNADVPVNDGDRIQIDDMYLGSLLDYCVHLAMFKEGGQMFLDTMPLYKSFMIAAMQANAQLKAHARNFPILFNKAQADMREQKAEQAA